WLSRMGMGKVKPINQYRLTPGFGGLALCHIKQQSAALHAAGAASKRKPPNNGGNSVLIKMIMLVCFLRAIPSTN
ncbi:hypothetical protein, partial [Escherichia coli]|uniref:hypothetical protein n=1 Tax=Escherichia coli TaxID=562 RepID=UPI000BE5A449